MLLIHSYHSWPFCIELLAICLSLLACSMKKLQYRENLLLETKQCASEKSMCSYKIRLIWSRRISTRYIMLLWKRSRSSSDHVPASLVRERVNYLCVASSGLEARIHHINQARVILLPLHPESWDYWCVPPRPASHPPLYPSDDLCHHLPTMSPHGIGGKLRPEESGHLP